MDSLSSLNRNFIEKSVITCVSVLFVLFFCIYPTILKPEFDTKPFKNFIYVFLTFLIIHISWEKWFKANCKLLNLKCINWTFYLLCIPTVSFLIMGTRGLSGHISFLFILLGSLSFAVIDICFGVWVLKTLKIRMTKIQTLVISWIGGSYFAGWLVYIFGILGFRTELVRLAALVFMLILSRNEFKNFMKGLFQPPSLKFKMNSLWFSAFLTLAMILVYTGINRVTTPVWHYDAMMIHMAAPKSYAVDGFISYLPAIRISCVTPMLQCHFTPVYILFGEMGPKIYEAFCLIATCLISYSLCLSTGIRNRSYAYLASFIILTTPLVAFMSGLCYQGIPGLALILSIISFATSIHKNRFKHNKLLKYFFLLGIFFGYLYLAHVRSYVVLLPIAWILIPIIYIQLKNKNFTGLLLNCFFLAFMSLVITSPVLIRLWDLLGNPFFPLLASVFGNSPEVLSIEEMKVLSKILSDTGCGTSLYDFLALPQRLLFKAEAFHGGGPLSIGAFLCTGIGIVFFGFIKKPLWLTLYFLVFFGFWFFKAQEMRYILMFIPVMAIAYSHGAKKLFSKYPYLLFLQCVTAILFFLYHYPNSLQENSNVVITKAEKNRFLTGRVIGYRAIKQLEKFTSIDENVFQIGLEGSKFSYKNPGKMLGDYLGKYQYSRITGFQEDFSKLKIVMDEWKVKFCVFNPNSFIKIDIPSFLKSNADKIEVIGIYDTVLVFAIKDNFSKPLYNTKHIGKIEFNALPKPWNIAAGKTTSSSKGLILHPGASIFMMKKTNNMTSDTSLKLMSQIGQINKKKTHVKLQVVWLTKNGWNATYSGGQPMIDVASSKKELTDETININLEASQMMPDITDAHISITNEGKNDCFIHSLDIYEININRNN